MSAGILSADRHSFRIPIDPWLGLDIHVLSEMIFEAISVSNCRRGGTRITSERFLLETVGVSHLLMAILRSGKCSGVLPVPTRSGGSTPEFDGNCC